MTDRETHLAVVGVGYADGIPREREAGAGVEIDGVRYPLVGRVSMDQIVIDTGAVRFPGARSRPCSDPKGSRAVGAGVGAVGGNHPAHDRHRNRAASAEECRMTTKVLVIGGDRTPSTRCRWHRQPRSPRPCGWAITRSRA